MLFMMPPAIELELVRAAPLKPSVGLLDEISNEQISLEIFKCPFAGMSMVANHRGRCNTPESNTSSSQSFKSSDSSAAIRCLATTSDFFTPNILDRHDQII
jgi:hypothetical protein